MVTMSKQHLKNILSGHHLKLWACALGIIVAMSLAAATPSLTNNSVAAGSYRPTYIRTHGPAGVLINQASEASVSPSSVGVQGTTQASAATQSVQQLPTPVPAIYGGGYMCPMIEGAQSGSPCGRYCTDSVYPCGCYGGGGAELMCAMPEQALKN